MQAAFVLGESRPASAALIFSRQDGAGAILATNTGIAAIVQRVIGNVVIADVAPHLCGVPVGDRVNFDDVEFRVPADLKSASTVRSLIAANSSDPSRQVG